MSNLDEFLKKMLNSRASASEQRYIERQLEREENNQSEISDSRWLGIDSNTGEGVALNVNNQPVRGNVVFNSQQVPGQQILGLNASRQTFNAMPAPHPGQIARVQYTSRTDRGKVAIIAELIYEGNSPLPCSCKEDPKYANIAILYSKVRRKQGPPPPELCPCDRNVFYDTASDSCQAGACQGGEFSSIEECEIFIDNLRNNSTTINHYYATANITTGGAYDNNQYTASKPPTSATRLSYDLAAEGSMWIVRPKEGAGIINDYSSLEQKFYFRDNNGTITYYEWWEVDIFYAGGQYIYWLNGTPIANYAYISTKNMLSAPVSFPMSGNANGVTGSIFLAGRGTHYTKPRYNESDPLPPPSPLPGSPDWNNKIVPFFAWWGTVAEWGVATEIIPPSPPSGSPPIGTYDGEGHYTITYYLGGFTQVPVKIGEYVLANISGGYSTMPFDQDVEGVTDEIFGIGYYGESVVEAFVCAIAPNQFEVVVNYGEFVKRNVFTEGTTVDTRFGQYWCAKDVFRFGEGINYKKTYKYPQQPELHPNNWMGNFLSSWAKNDFQKVSGPIEYTDGSRESLKNAILITAKDSFGMPPQYVCYLNNLINNYRLPKRPVFRDPNDYQKIPGAEAGEVNLYPYNVSRIGLNLFADGENIYGVDADGHQLFNGEQFVDAIKTKDVDNLIIKGGKLKLHAQSENLFYKAITNLAFEENQSGSLFIPKCYSLKEPLCRIIQIAVYAPLETLKSFDNPVYSYLIKANFVWSFGDGEYQEQGLYTYSTKYWSELYKPKPNPLNPVVGWPTISINSGMSVDTTNYGEDPTLGGLIPLNFRDCGGAITGTINSVQSSLLTVSYPSPLYSIVKSDYPSIADYVFFLEGFTFGGQIIGMCL